MLALFASAPILIVWVGGDPGAEFVLYREPKLVATGILGWILLAALLLVERRRLGWDELGTVLREPVVYLLGAFVVCGAVSLAWVRVWQNHAYEMGQYALLFPLLVLLVAWGRRDPLVARTIRAALLAALAFATLAGFLQGAGALPFLVPIDPQYGVSNPSLLGYKNPMALALLGQWFLLLGLTSTSRTTGRRIALAVVLAAETVYLVSLQSRTSYLGLGLGLAVVFIGGALVAPSRSALIAAALALVVAGSAIVVQPELRQRAFSAWTHATDSQRFLASDRGTYLLNTLHMVRLVPWGVGLGDWQTNYPVYRKYRREVSFTDEVQVRRAHSDHIQVLGELGWLGFLAWSAFLAAAILTPLRRFRVSRGPDQLCLAAQVIAIVAAMATDYWIEVPALKLELFLVLGLVLLPEAREASQRETPARRPVPGFAVAAAIIVCGVQVVYYAGLLRRACTAARIEAGYSALGAGSDVRLVRGREARLAQLRADGRDFERGWGHTKTFFKDHLLLSVAAAQLGDVFAAERHALRALRLHPYSPNALHWMAVLLRSRDPSRADEWMRAYEHVMKDAEDGFELVYPGTSGPLSR